MKQDERIDRLAGIAYMMLGIASFASMDAIGKWLVRDISVFQILAVRSTVVTLVLVAAFPLMGGFSLVRSPQLRAHGIRALCGVGAFLFFFTSVRFLPLADAVAVFFGGPFIVTALAVPLLGEHVDGRRWLAVAVGFVGMLLIVQPTGRKRPSGRAPRDRRELLPCTHDDPHSLDGAPPERGKDVDLCVLHVFVQAIAGWLACALAPGSLRAMNGTHIAFILAMGALALAGHFGITRAFQRAPVSVVAPFEYTALVWATLLGFVVWGRHRSHSVWKNETARACEHPPRRRSRHRRAR